MSAATIALLAEVIAGQERILERLEKLEHTVIDEHNRVESLATLAAAAVLEHQALPSITR